MISDNDKNNNVQNEQIEFININQNNYEDNDDLNFGQVNNLGINVKEKKKTKEPITKKRNKTKKTKTKEAETNKISTTFKTLSSREIAIQNTNLLDIYNSGKKYEEYIKEKEKEEEEKNTIINENVNIKKVNESDIPEPTKVEDHVDGNGDGDSDDSDDDLFNVSEEDEEIKKQRSAAIEKMTKKYDEIVPIPDFNIFDETKINMFKKTNDFYKKEKK